jgi:tetraacyldisaccharide 4'-kinase
MAMRAPNFWGPACERSVADLLAPTGWLYGLGTRLRLATMISWRAPVPIICIGNLTAGGSGKTPLAMEITRRLPARGDNPHLLTRGYGGNKAGPLLVNPAVHDTHTIGDEALLLAAIAPTWVSRHRASGAAAAVAAGASVIVMDDGLQNPDLVKDLSIVVVDGTYGFGNERLIPAGPLRESVTTGLARADAVVVIGDDSAGVIATVAQQRGSAFPILVATVHPQAEAAAALSKQRVVAFAGIARPERFFATLESIGCSVIDRFAFADHHAYKDAELSAIAERAGDDTLIVTTAKDAARLQPAWRARVNVLPIQVRFADESALEILLSSALENR